VRQTALANGAFDAVVTDNWALGGVGAKGLAESVVRACDQEAKPRQLYELNNTIQAKIEVIAAKIYGMWIYLFVDVTLTLCLFFFYVYVFSVSS
jgi:methylenetetrahydrofolate dehydrogenase (NADP+)/methenyltetrahydrofolate cyclohydrolase/formyltetrahydrofolate synthetase